MTHPLTHPIRPEDLIIVSAHHTVYCHLIGIEFANCEVVEMSLAPATEGGAWQDRWSVADSDGEMIPLYQEDGARATCTDSWTTCFLLSI